MSEQRGSGASGHEAAVGTNSPAGEFTASSSSFVGSARRLSAIRDALGDGALRLAYHAAVPVVVDADLLNLLRVNFFLDDPPDVLPFEVEAELLLSPLFGRSARACTGSTPACATSSFPACTPATAMSGSAGWPRCWNSTPTRPPSGGRCPTGARPAADGAELP